ncbi:unnamed protein product [Leptosia nina]|uniref:Tudor domain-containing protein 1 n=1 Tax=Leptosia nina TaxID=320188 RepID=A0AAV1JC69_9NEOP
MIIPMDGYCYKQNVKIIRSFADLATIALHRRNELDSRIKTFLGKCDLSIQNIVKLKCEVQGLMNKLNCEPSDLKQTFLNCAKTIDEYTYLITDFNIAIENLGKGSVDLTPVLDTTNKLIPKQVNPVNIIDMLTEPVPSTSNACVNNCQVPKPIKKRIPKEEQLLISFSSSSCSAESVPIITDSTAELTDGVKDISLDPIMEQIKNTNIPAQVMLQVDKQYPGVILYVDGISFWMATGSIDQTFFLLNQMAKHYKDNYVQLSLRHVTAMTYCALFDDECHLYYRALFLKLIDNDTSLAEVFLIDLGETRLVHTCRVQPLAPQFCIHAPLARCYHLAGVEHIDNEDVIKQFEQFMLQYLATDVIITIDDNTSESLGVYVEVVKTREIINDLVVAAGLAVKIDKNSANSSPRKGIPELSENSYDIGQDPEYEDPVLAVTGYHNRDEADICKHYTGGPQKTCFKGARCQKKHIVKHPDGWTLDRVTVPGKVNSLALPSPGTWLRVIVTHVAHFNRFYVHLATNNEDDKAEHPKFGVILPATTLPSLIRDMNSPATKISYKPLELAPAPGELVAALYPPDEQWYRARVTDYDRTIQSVEVFFIDFGNTLWVKEDKIRCLDTRFLVLPAQAMACVLGRVKTINKTVYQINTYLEPARAHLEKLIQDRKFEAYVTSTNYDSITVDLCDETGHSVADALAKTKLVQLYDYVTEEDTTAQQKMVVP